MLSHVHAAPKPDAKLAPLPPARSEAGYRNGSILEPAEVRDTTLAPRERHIPRSAPKRILIVEDNELSLKLLNDVLEFHGYTIISTQLGAAAVDLARQHRPDLILLDIQLPDIPGTEAAGRLKADPETRAIPIIAVTAFAMSGDRKKILDSGCDDYVSKPFNVLGFLALVERYTNKVAIEAEPLRV
jgi:two-component system, cell cycle response regulator DivK